MSWRSRLAELEHALYDREFRRRRIEASDRHPIIDDHSSTHHRATSIDTARHKRHLQQTRQLILILNRCLWVNYPALIRQREI